MPKLNPSCCSLSLISLSDFLPKLRYFSISASVFWASCPTVVMFALFKQFAARTLSSISFTLMLSSFFSLRFSSLTPAGVSEENLKLKKLLNMSVNEIELSVRAANCLNNANITTVGQLAQKTESEMLKYRNFGKKSLNEIKDKLQQLGLSLGMKFEAGLVEPVAGGGASVDGASGNGAATATTER